ncbi:MAG: mechanosensitive ion channel protein MscS [Phycisphaerae bacterium]|nr:mechanosensitive ion channel protein MscS [Phycisphaerae bacterium]MBM92830.1 mechanosensitive ion channel protein MscS [Phycisphaerae bacterium]HCT44948.1 mechanosensitive ion channel protein MscS [Phycisphaerales bacterium]
MLFMQEGEAVDAANATEQTNELVSGGTEAASRLMEGDFSGDTWVLLWDSVGWPITKAVVLIILVIIIASWVSKITGKAVRKANVEETLARFLSNLARYVVLIAGAVAILGTLGVETTSFAALIAAVGFAIGMAMSGMLGNVASGVMLLFFRPFKVGDVVAAGGTTGKVFEIGLFTTTFDTPDNRRIIVPNNSIFGGTIENISHHATRRVSIDVGTDYGADIDKAREIMLAAASATDNVLTDPAPAVVLAGLGGSSIDWSVRVWVNAADYWAVMDALTRNVKVALDDAGIGIPFPQMDVHIDGKVAQG